MALVTQDPTVVYKASEGERFAGTSTLHVVTCATCHVTYAIPQSFYTAAQAWTGDRDDGRGWKICCPFGHTWWYAGKETKAERLERQLRGEREHSARLAAERDQAKASARAQRGAATRARNQRDRDRQRVAAGVCPCCNRSFTNLARHMAGQHPEFGPLGDA